jgi:hypothetical protein
MNNLFVALSIDEIKELVQFVSGFYGNVYAKLEDNPVLVNAWVKLKSELDLVEASHNEE